MDTLQLLKELENARAHLQVLQMDREKKRSEVMAPVCDALAEIDIELCPVIDTVIDQCERLEAELKAAVIKSGESVKSEWLHAIYQKPRETWDGKSLSGYSAAHPEILAFRKIGDPTVTIRASR